MDVGFRHCASARVKNRARLYETYATRRLVRNEMTPPSPEKDRLRSLTGLASTETKWLEERVKVFNIEIMVHGDNSVIGFVALLVG